MGILMRSAAIGLLAGMRTFAPPAWIERPGRGRSKKLWPLAAVFEMAVFDKLPFVASRASAPQIAGRIFSGAACAAYSCRKKKRRIAPALVGAAAAAAGAHATFRARRWVGKRLNVPDGVVGAAEDLMAVGLGKLLARRSG